MRLLAVTCDIAAAESQPVVTLESVFTDCRKRHWPAVSSVLLTGLRALGLGFAVGGRASAGLTALSLSSGSSDPAWLRSTPARVLTGLSSVGEAIGDQLPSAPSRLEGPGLASRLLVGAGSGALVARRYQAPVVLGGVLGLAGSFAGSHLGARWRREATSAFGHDRPGALIEDAVVVAIAAAATRL
jgi:uncharacterized membrane protein